MNSLGEDESETEIHPKWSRTIYIMAVYRYCESFSTALAHIHLYALN